MADERVFLVIQDGPPTLVDAKQVARFDVVVAIVADSPAGVRTTPVIDHPEWIAADAEVLVEPVAAARRRRHEAAREVLELAHLTRLAVFPRRWTDFNRPVVGVALAAQAHEHRA